MPNVTQPLQEYLDDRSAPEPNTGCVLWTGSVGQDGYGKACHNWRRWRAHRLAWAAKHGDPGDRLVCHKCDVPLCINPDHLFLGTPAENSADMTAKGRSTWGRRNGRAKLTPDAVRAIRASGLTQKALADEFGVSPATISMAKTGACWAHVT